MKERSLPIGTIIKLPFAKLKVVEDKEIEGSCFDCVFKDCCPGIVPSWFGACGGYNRADEKSVHFEEVKE